MMLRSFRARLTIWNVAILTLALVISSSALVVGTYVRRSAEIDRELRDRARPPGPGQRGPGGGPMGRGFRQDEGPQDRVPRLADLGLGAGAIQELELRRPRMFDREGRTMGLYESPVLDEAAVQRALGGQASFSSRTIGGQPYRVFTAPRRDRGDIIGAIQVGRNTRDLQEMWQAQLRSVLLFVPLVILTAAAGALVLTGRAMRPIKQMRDAAAEIGEEDLSKRLDVQGEDELAELARSFNGMVARLEESFERQRRAYRELEEAHENQRRFTADASHELRTPLTRLRLATSGALGPAIPLEEKEKALQTADAAATTMGRLVQELLVLARADAGQLRVQLEPQDLRVVVSDALNELPSEDARIQVAFPDEPVPAEVDAMHIKRAVTNLVENALRHTPENGKIAVRVLPAEGGAEIVVQDNGEGIAREHLPHVTDRFYRVDDARARTDGGVGLGLAITKALAEAHGGRLEIESEKGVGTKAKIFLPRSQIK